MWYNMSGKPDPAKHPGVKQLRAALVDRLCTAGTCTVAPESLGLYYRKANKKDATFINLADTDNSELEALNAACQPEKSGRGTKVVDETARKMDPSNFASAFDLGCSGIMEIIGSDLVKSGETKRVKAELHKLNIYDKGSFSKPHSAKNVFATLVTVFPTPHKGGALVLRREGQEQFFHSPSNKSEIAYIAFYSDTKHEVLPVTSGYRIALTYNLYLEDTSENIKPLDTSCKAALQELLNDSSFLPEGGRLAFGLQHQYQYDTKPPLASITELFKGSDATLYRVCKDLGLKINLRILYDTGYDEILLSEWVDLSGYLEVCDVAWVLKRDFKSEVISTADLDWDAPDLPVVVWVTPKTEFNRVKDTYPDCEEPITHDLEGDLCLIVEIDDHASKR